MSVEEARAEVITFTNCRDDLDARALEEALDDLIREVKASMPCYFEWNGDGENCGDIEGPPEPDDPCPSCAARAEKVKA